MINLELPKKFGTLVAQSHQVATEVFRPNSRKYDTAEHEYPKELDMLAALIDGMNESGALGGAGAGTVGGGSNGSNGSKESNGSTKKDDGNRNGSNMASLLGLIELCWGDVGLLLAMPHQGLGPGGDRRCRQRGAARALRRKMGGDGDHRAGGRILDLFEGTQQIQLLIIARLLLGKTSTELK